MTPEQTSSLLITIAEHVYGKADGSSGTAPVKLTIGYIAKTRMVMHDGIVIINAPASIINAVMNWVSQQQFDNSHSRIRAEAGLGGLIVR